MRKIFNNGTFSFWKIPVYLRGISFAFYYRKPRFTKVLGRPLIILPSVFPPGRFNYGTFFLNNLHLDNKKILEIGCGTGINSIILSKRFNDITCTDINPIAVKCTKLNAELNNVKINTFQSNFFENINGKFDYVIFNTPYFILFDERKNIEIYWQGYSMKVSDVNRFVKQVKSHLTKKGNIFLSIYSGHERVWINVLKDFDVQIIARKNIFFTKVSVLKAIKK